jgi:protein-disulfide isomerase
MRLSFVSFALVAVAAFTLSACSQGGGEVTSDDMSMGNAKAPVTMIEYASASCPHCAEFNNEVFPAFKAKYIDTGKVHYVFREFLTPPENVAAAGFMTARCAGRDKYFSVLDAIYRGQRAMFESGDFHGTFQRIAESAGVSDAQFEKCINDSAGLKAMNDRIDGYIKNNGIESTPTFVINGTKLTGEQTLATLDQAVAVAQAGKH